MGHARAHHGELLQGVFEDGDGELRRGLVTLPLPGRGSRAVFRPAAHHWGIVGARDLTKVRRAAILTLRALATHPAPARAPAKGGELTLTSDVPHGVGMGSSTSDVTATIRAVAHYHGVTLPATTVCRLAVAAERACDSIMIEDRVVLFAHRDGRVLETLGYRLPPMVVVGCDTEPGGWVDTLRFPPAAYRPEEMAGFRVLRAALRRAVATGDAALLGRVATASARINQHHLPKPALPALLALVARLGGYGVQIAHSGTVAGLLLPLRGRDHAGDDPAAATSPGDATPGDATAGDATAEEVVDAARAGLAGLGLPVTAVIRVAG